MLARQEGNTHQVGVQRAGRSLLNPKPQTPNQPLDRARRGSGRGGAKFAVVGIGLCRNEKRFRGELVCTARRLVYHSIVKRKKKRFGG